MMSNECQKVNNTTQEMIGNDIISTANNKT